MDYTNEQQDELKFTIEEVNQILSDGIIVLLDIVVKMVLINP